MIKMIRLIVIILFIGFISSSSVKLLFQDPIKEEMGEDEKIAIRIINETTKILEKKYKIHFSGMGMGGMNELNSIAINFQVKRILSKNDARKIIIDCAQELLKNINSDGSIKSYLTNYPFTLQNVNVVFYISDSSGRELCHPHISVAKCTRGKLIFRTDDPDNEFAYKESYEETYEEALQLINKDKNE